ncbi:MAG: hypothetical protein ABI746_05790 [Dermatophilaceae bacterium]
MLRDGSDVVAVLWRLREKVAGDEPVDIPGWSSPGGCTAAELDELISIVTGAEPDVASWTDAQRVRRDPDYARRALADPACDPALLGWVLTERPGSAAFYAQGHPHAPVGVLSMLADSPDAADRAAAAMARATPPAVLAGLLNDSDDRVRGTVAHNVWSPSQVVRAALSAGLIDPQDLADHHDVPWDAFDDVPVEETTSPGWDSEQMPGYLLWRFAGRTGGLEGRGRDEVADLDFPSPDAGETFAVYADRIEASHGEAVRRAHESALG